MFKDTPLKLRVQDHFKEEDNSLPQSRVTSAPYVGRSPPFLRSINLSYKKQCRDAVLSIISTFDVICAQASWLTLSLAISRTGPT